MKEKVGVRVHVENRSNYMNSKASTLFGFLIPYRMQNVDLINFLFQSMSLCGDRNNNDSQQAGKISSPHLEY